jgi:mannose-6-phosphate isomerase-like protein (cupin superfamily)
MEAINIMEKFSKFEKIYHPYIIGEFNDNYIKLAKLKDEFVWHKHDAEDELFIVFKGTLIMDFEDKTVNVGPGEILIVPKGVLHRPRSNGEEVLNMLIEPKATKHTGDTVSEMTVSEQEWI